MWVGAVVEEVGEEVDAVADVAGVVVVDVEGVGAGDGGTVAEEIVEEVDHIAQLDRSIGVGIATDEGNEVTFVGDAVGIIVGRTSSDVALVRDTVGIAVLGDSQQDVTLVENTIAVAVCRGRELTSVWDSVPVAVCGCSRVDLTFIGYVIKSAIRRDTQTDITRI